MDRDVAKPLYESIKKDNPEEPIIFLSIACGIVQESSERKEALRTILEYISQHQKKISRVIATDHDHTCGYVKHELGGTSLAEKIGVKVANHGEHSQKEEQEAMKSLIKQNAQYLKLRELFGDKLTIALAIIDRQSDKVTLDDNFSEIKSKSLIDF